jgi:2-polyprenyl-6-hydroxyphenyl methylase/3-demethylubiquinone-9 3-methyltransferase
MPSNQAPPAYLYTEACGNVSHHYLLRALKDFVDHLPDGSRIADLGCGNGSLLARVIRDGIEAHGIDSSPSGIEHAERAFPQITFHLADITGDLPPTLPEGSFDAVISTETIEHLPFPRRLLSNAYQLLKPGGCLLISTPYHGYLKNLALALSGRMDSHFTALWDGGHIKFWSRKTLWAVLAECGFRETRFQGLGRAPLLWKSQVFTARKPN